VTSARDGNLVDVGKLNGVAMGIDHRELFTLCDKHKPIILVASDAVNPTSQRISATSIVSGAPRGERCRIAVLPRGAADIVVFVGVNKRDEFFVFLLRGRREYKK
jgi:hypothetical protein